jgi:WD repeat-containing protein 19
VTGGRYEAAAALIDAAIAGSASVVVAGGRRGTAPSIAAGGSGATVSSGSGGTERSTDPALAAAAAVCVAGIARMSLRLGDVRRGMRLAAESGDKGLCRDCAAILESLKQGADAAALYERGESFERATAIYISTKNFAAAAALLPRIAAPKLHAQYAKAKEAEGDFAEAARAYERARDGDSVVRLLLGPLRSSERALELVRASASASGAQLVAAFCQTSGDYRGAIEFLLLAKRSDEAFSLALAHRCMDAYCAILGDRCSAEEAGAIARHFETAGNFARAGEYYALASAYGKALKHFLAAGESQIERAIAVVGRARSDMLTHTLIDYLMGESDGVPKHPNYIYRLYMALGNYPQAVKTAIIIGRQEQELGNYKLARDVLFETHRELDAQKIRVPLALRRSLLLLHSYALVKKLVRSEQHGRAAAMLVRVVRSLSKFPAHAVPILTSAVIECHRAGLKATSYEFAVTLMRPEYRGGIEEKYKRRIEQIVRRPNKEEAEEPSSPCPFCATPLPDSNLECGACKNSLPYCIVTGLHMTRSDWSHCPNCRFPGLYSAFGEYLAKDPSGACPMCDKPVLPSALVLVEDPSAALAALAGDVEEDDPEAAAAAVLTSSTGSAITAAASVSTS